MTKSSKKYDIKENNGLPPLTNSSKSSQQFGSGLSHCIQMKILSLSVSFETF